MFIFSKRFTTPPNPSLLYSSDKIETDISPWQIGHTGGLTRLNLAIVPDFVSRRKSCLVQNLLPAFLVLIAKTRAISRVFPGGGDAPNFRAIKEENGGGRAPSASLLNTALAKTSNFCTFCRSILFYFLLYLSCFSLNIDINQNQNALCVTFWRTTLWCAVVHLMETDYTLGDLGREKNSLPTSKERKNPSRILCQLPINFTREGNGIVDTYTNEGGESEKGRLWL